MPPVVEYFKKSEVTKQQVEAHRDRNLALSNVVSSVVTEGVHKGEAVWILTTQYEI